ncbi:hypothetical protein NOCA2150136 [metagenome]|uniref:Uncharacterized protein n=1 Tax=metagenome TaxID=256318 RepID=A0A2P2BXC6_9ZZZZ
MLPINRTRSVTHHPNPNSPTL